MCRVISSLLASFRDKKLLVIVEAEILKLGCMARPEDIVAWIEGVGILVVEVKSHKIEGISSFENGVPQVVYHGNVGADTGLLDQPKDFAYKLKGVLEKHFDDHQVGLPPLYFVGWLPNVSQADVLRKGAEVPKEKVWLADMLERDAMIRKLPTMKNLTRGDNTDRRACELFSQLFGVTSGLRQSTVSRSTMPATMGHRIDQHNLSLKQLTVEQQDLAFSSQLLRGPKVVRGVPGSGKTVVLVNAVAETLLREQQEQMELFPDGQKQDILVLCFNRVLARYLLDLIRDCFDHRNPHSDVSFPDNRLTVKNIDKYVFDLAQDCGLHYDYKDKDKKGFVSRMLQQGVDDHQRFSHVFIDEGQDIRLEWYPLICDVTKPGPEGLSITVFFDEGQNLYGIRRPGVGGAPSWTELLGAVPNPRGLSTIMRVGHRNTNAILSFSFSLLLGTFCARDPEMVLFSEISQYKNLKIPDDPSLDHPNAGRYCVEEIGSRHYRINFGVRPGDVPIVNVLATESEMLEALTFQIKRLIESDGNNVLPDDILVMAPGTKDVQKIIKVFKAAAIRHHYSGPHNRDEPLVQTGRVTVCTIKSAKGFTSPVCHIAFVHSLAQPDASLEAHQNTRAQLHVGCTRATIYLELWGMNCALMEEAQHAIRPEPEPG